MKLFKNIVEWRRPTELVVSYFNYDSLEILLPRTNTRLVFDFEFNDCFLNSQKTVKDFKHCDVLFNVSEAGSTDETDLIADSNHHEADYLSMRRDAKEFGITLRELKDAISIAEATVLAQFKKKKSA